MPKKPERFWLAALLLAWLIDLLFWNKAVGISFPIFITLLLAVGIGLNWGEGIRPGWKSLLLAAFPLLFSLLAFLRAEPLTQTLSILAALGLLSLLAATYRSGFWVHYRLVDAVVALFNLGIAAFSRQITAGLSRAQPADEPSQTPKSKFIQQAFPILRGLLLALPVVAILAVLLASADMIFAREMKTLLNIFDLNRLPEYLFRMVYILFFGYLLTGVYLHSAFPARQETRPDTEKNWFPSFLGSIEAYIVLGLVNLLFAFFVIIQFRYLFGGSANITETGFTYADYARRGFFELVAVALISLGLYMTLGTVTRRSSAGQRRAFSTLSILLMVQVLIILVSAFQRLFLYESAYGFSRLRTYTHIFIPWLGALLISVIILEIVRRPGRLALALLSMAAGFVLTLGLVNVDGFIVHQNLARARLGFALDGEYLVTLSSDAVQSMVAGWQNADLPDKAREELSAALACRVAIESAKPIPAWQSYHLSQSQALAALKANAPLWKDTPTRLQNGIWMVKLGGKERRCIPTRTFMD
ncbi:MAG TPA: DUF4173 domain-containing protein [Anaerolineaceae bacterium]